MGKKENPSEETERKQRIKGEINQVPFLRSQLRGKQPGRHPSRQNGSNTIHSVKTSQEWSLHTIAETTQHIEPHW